MNCKKFIVSRATKGRAFPNPRPRRSLPPQPTQRQGATPGVELGSSAVVEAGTLTFREERMSVLPSIP